MKENARRVLVVCMATVLILCVLSAYTTFACPERGDIEECHFKKCGLWQHWCIDASESLNAWKDGPDDTYVKQPFECGAEFKWEIIWCSKPVGTCGGKAGLPDDFE